MSKRTYQPKKSARRHRGFLALMSKVGGRNIIRRRRAKGRVSLASGSK